jgi:hypothetical protein
MTPLGVSEFIGVDRHRPGVKEAPGSLVNLLFAESTRFCHSSDQSNAVQSLTPTSSTHVLNVPSRRAARSSYIAFWIVDRVRVRVRQRSERDQILGLNREADLLAKLAPTSAAPAGRHQCNPEFRQSLLVDEFVLLIHP